MLHESRQMIDGVWYDYVIILQLRNGQETIFCHDQGIFEGHVKLAQLMKQTYTAYTWNTDHNCYVQSSCYPTVPMPCLK